MGQVLVLNASYEPLNVCTVRRAHVLLYKGMTVVKIDREKCARYGLAANDVNTIVSAAIGGQAEEQNPCAIF